MQFILQTFQWLLLTSQDIPGSSRPRGTDAQPSGALSQTRLVPSLCFLIPWPVQMLIFYCLTILKKYKQSMQYLWQLW